MTDPSAAVATCDVTVFLADVNDNKPKFDLDSYEFMVGLSFTSGLLLGKINTTDADSLTNAEWDLILTYENPPG